MGKGEECTVGSLNLCTLLACRVAYMGRDPWVGPFNSQSIQVRTKYFPNPFIRGFLSPFYLTRRLNRLSLWVSGFRSKTNTL